MRDDPWSSGPDDRPPPLADPEAWTRRVLLGAGLAVVLTAAGLVAVALQKGSTSTLAVALLAAAMVLGVGCLAMLAPILLSRRRAGTDARRRAGSDG